VLAHFSCCETLDKGSAVPLDGVPTIEEIRRRIIREIVDADVQTARRRRSRTLRFRSTGKRLAGRAMIVAFTRLRRKR
jgi:hypothetical protein